MGLINAIVGGTVFYLVFGIFIITAVLMISNRSIDK